MQSRKSRIPNRTSQPTRTFVDMLPVSELATLAGDADSRAIHFDAASVRYLWLDRLRQTRKASRVATQTAQVPK